MNKVLFVLCEGPHDVAFLYRIFKVVGFNQNNKNIIDYPQPLNEYLKNEIIKSHMNYKGHYTPIFLFCQYFFKIISSESFLPP